MRIAHCGSLVLPAAGVLACALASCGAPSDAPEGTTVTDSAGVARVHYGRGALEGAPELALTEILRIGTLDGPPETQFFSLVGAVERRGEIYLLDRGHSQVRVFSADGAFLRSFGGEGGGPGEFTRPSLIGFLGDTLVVTGQRVNLLDTDGGLLATARAQVAVYDDFLMRSDPTSIGWISEWLLRPNRTAPRGELLNEATALYRVDRPTIERRTAVFSFPRAESRISRGEFPFFVRPYFQASPTHHVGPDGSIYYAPGDGYRIDVLDGSTGGLVRRVTADPEPAPITDALLDRAVEAERERVREAPPGSESAMFAPVIDEKLALGTADNLPVLGRMYASESGWLLVLRLDLDPDPVAPGDPTTWDLFDPGGRLAGRLTLGVDTRILRLADDGVLAVVRGELDVQSFVKYRFAGW